MTGCTNLLKLLYKKEKNEQKSMVSLKQLSLIQIEFILTNEIAKQVLENQSFYIGCIEEKGNY